MPRYVSIIATHQARLRCLGSDLFRVKFHRFMNGAVVRIEINDYGVICSLAHQGELDSEENNAGKTYYVQAGPGVSEEQSARGREDASACGAQAEDFSGRCATRQALKERGIRINTDGNTYVFFLIRHGQGYHNLTGKVKAAMGPKDTALTDKGFEQARRTGKQIETYNNGEFFQATTLFCSDLRRTALTLATVLDATEKGKELLQAFAPFFVLPCAHELHYAFSEGKDAQSMCDAAGMTSRLKSADKANQSSKSEWAEVPAHLKAKGVLVPPGVDTVFYIEQGRRKGCRDKSILQLAIDLCGAKSRQAVPQEVETAMLEREADPEAVPLGLLRGMLLEQNHMRLLKEMESEPDNKERQRSLKEAAQRLRDFQMAGQVEAASRAEGETPAGVPRQQTSVAATIAAVSDTESERAAAHMARREGFTVPAADSGMGESSMPPPPGGGGKRKKIKRKTNKRRKIKRNHTKKKSIHISKKNIKAKRRRTARKGNK